MKKAFLTILMMAILVCALTIVCSAKEVSSLDEIKSGIANAQENDELVFDMTADILIPNASSGIIIDKNITVTINTNGHLIYANVGSAGAGTVYGFKLTSAGAKLIMNGATTDVDYKNYVEPKDETITASNGVIINPNKDKGIKSPDFASNGPAIVVMTGSIELNDMYINQYNSGEWAVVYLTNSNDSARVHNGKFRGCIIKSGGNKYTAVSMRDKGGTLAECVITMEDCVFYGLGHENGADSVFSVGTGSYMKNVRIEKYSPTFDSNLSIYMKDEDAFRLENVIFKTTQAFNIATGRVHFDFINCTFEENCTMKMSGDSAGDAVVNIINTPTCTSVGTKTKYVTPRNGTTTFTTEELPIIDHSATDDNDCTTDVLCDMCKEVVVYPKQFDAHKLHTLSIKYANGFAKEGLKTMVCENCESATNASPTLPLFVAQGYTVNEGNTGFGTGFQINKGALVEYESANNTTITFGIVVFNPQHLNGETFVDGKINATKGALQINMDTSYANCKLLISGFTQAHASLELVFVGYAYEGDNSANLQLMQKEYISTEDAPVESPMCSQINGLYTVKLSTVATPSMVGNKESLDEFVKKSA